MIIQRVARWIDNRLGASRAARTTLNKVFPDHWSFMLGEVALYCFVILVLTGVYLTFFFTPGTKEVVYHGSYAPLDGVKMSQAYESVLRISFDVRAGLVMRQIHHWAALMFVAAVIAHLMRIFFTGAFRRPREINWMIGVTLLILAIANGFTGYSLPDDQLSGTGLRIAYSVVLSVPVAGVWTAFLIFGGEFPGNEVLTRFFVIHILIIPVAIAVLLGAHLAILVRQKHTQFPGRGRANTNVVGARLWPTFMAKTLGLFFLTFAVLAALGGLAQINPVWIWGPFEPAAVSAGSQPDWYVGWLEGSLRLFPAWETRLFGFEIPNPFYSGVVIPGITFMLLYAWAFLEARVTKDYEEHHLLDRPRDRPVRTSIGVAALTFYVILFAAGGNDVLAARFDISVNLITWVFRIFLLVLPPLTALLTYRLCRELQARDHEKPRPTAVLERTQSGGYVEVEEPAGAPRA
ncbi:MAG: ubiquinol-cytochrome c reductase cytochrome b subunit [Actinobacteria bacterium]|nr:ubiquinol-cytochrome c reductase cytochrome b subunit [Actinomycetota bacterium]